MSLAPIEMVEGKMRMDKSIINKCAEHMLKAVPWEPDLRVGSPFVCDFDGEYLDDHPQMVQLTEDCVAAIRQMETSLEAVLSRGEDIDLSESIDEEDYEGVKHWLGWYTPMQPRGIITLHLPRLTSFFWHLILELNKSHQITAQQLGLLAQASVAKTYWHELFHHQADVCQLLLGGKKDRLHEEALAVAYSWDQVQRWPWYLDEKKLPKALITDFLIAAYQYSSPGYRDWPDYRDRWSFEKARLSYFLHPASLRLLESASRHGGRDLHHLLHRLELGEEAGFFDVRVFTLPEAEGDG